VQIANDAIRYDEREVGGIGSSSDGNEYASKMGGVMPRVLDFCFVFNHNVISNILRKSTQVQK
jgi:hypothetical protein